MAEVIDMELNDEGVYVPQRSNTGLWALGSITAVGALAVGAYLWRSRKAAAEVVGDGDTGEPRDASSETNEEPSSGSSGRETLKAGGFTWKNVRPLPRPADVPGFDLTSNWGTTPKDLRPLFALMEEVSGIEGSGRIFAIIAKREAGFVATAHNSSAHETSASRRAYKNAKGRNQPLKYGVEAGEFGSGGLFGALAPYYLWTGVQEAKANAPLLNSRPEIMFLPRVAGFGACVYMQRLLDNYQIDDHADIKVGWASPSLLKKGRGGDKYKAVRERFFSDAKKLGIDLADTSTIPAKLSASRWPGVLRVFDGLVGKLPTPAEG